MAEAGYYTLPVIPSFAGIEAATQAEMDKAMGKSGKQSGEEFAKEHDKAFRDHVTKQHQSDSTDTANEIKKAGKKSGEIFGEEHNKAFREKLSKAGGFVKEYGGAILEAFGPEIGREAGNRAANAIEDGLNKAIGGSGWGKEASTAIADWAGDAIAGRIGDWSKSISDAKKGADDLKKAGVQSFAEMGQSASGASEKIRGALTGALGTVKNAAGEAKKSVGAIGDDLKSGASEKIRGALTGALGTVKNAAGEAKKSVGAIGDDLKSGNVDGAVDRISGALRGLEDPAKKVGVDISGWSSGIDDVHNKARDAVKPFQNIRDDVKDVAELIGGLGAATGLGGLETLAASLGAIAIPVAAIAAAVVASKWWWDKIDEWDRAKIPNQANLPFNPDTGAPRPGLDLHSPDTPQQLYTYGPGQSVPYTRPPAGPPAPPGPPAAPPPPGHGAPAPAPAPRPPAPNKDDPAYKYTHGIRGGPPAGEGSTDWEAIAGAESSGNWSNPDTGHTGHYGGLQFDLPTWRDFGGTDFAPRPDMATKDQQIEVANRVPPSQRPGRWAQTWWTQTGRGAGGSNATSTGSGSITGAPSGALTGGNDYGAAAGHPTAPPPDERRVRAWVEQNFGIRNTFGTGSWENAAHDADGGWHHNLTHDKSQPGYAFDFRGTDAQMDALANWISQNYAQDTLELIHQGPGFDPNNEIKNAKRYNYGPALNAQHGPASDPGGHVHWAMTRAPLDAGLTGDGSMPRGSSADPLFVMPAPTGSGGSRSTYSGGGGGGLGGGNMAGDLGGIGNQFLSDTFGFGSIFPSLDSFPPLQFLFGMLGGMFGGGKGSAGALGNMLGGRGGLNRFGMSPTTGGENLSATPGAEAIPSLSAGLGDAADPGGGVQPGTTAVDNSLNVTVNGFSANDVVGKVRREMQWGNRLQTYTPPTITQGG